MRGVLIVNPRATTTSPAVTDVLVHALAGELDLDVVMTTHKGHGYVIGEHARAERLDIVVTLGGDGTIHEIVNGMLADGTTQDLPLLATVPGGSGNVFARSCGLPNDAVEAAGQILAAMRAGRSREIGIGRFESEQVDAPRWFVANAGVGLDAEIIAAMDAQRREGKTASPARYLSTTLRQLFTRTNRKEPALTIERDHHEPIDHVFLAIIQNTSPWTYFGPLPLNPCPAASFDTGLDVFALRNLRLHNAAIAAQRILTSSKAGSTRSAIRVLHDQPELRISATRPMDVQLDGEGIGALVDMRFSALHQVIRVVA